MLRNKLLRIVMSSFGVPSWFDHFQLKPFVIGSGVSRLIDSFGPVFGIMTASTNFMFSMTAFFVASSSIACEPFWFRTVMPPIYKFWLWAMAKAEPRAYRFKSICAFPLPMSLTFCEPLYLPTFLFRRKTDGATKSKTLVVELIFVVPVSVVFLMMTPSSRITVVLDGIPTRNGDRYVPFVRTRVPPPSFSSRSK